MFSHSETDTISSASELSTADMEIVSSSDSEIQTKRRKKYVLHDNHACRDYCDMKLKLEDLSRHVNSLSYVADCMNEKIMRVIDQLAANPWTSDRKTLKSVAFEAIENKITARMTEKRANQKWRTDIETFNMDGISSERMNSVREILLNGPKNPSETAIQIAKTIWSKNYLSVRLVGPRSKQARSGERNEILSEKEEAKLRDCLSKLTRLLLGDIEWKILVRDPINQASLKPKDWFEPKLTTIIERIPSSPTNEAKIVNILHDNME